MIDYFFYSKDVHLGSWQKNSVDVVLRINKIKMVALLILKNPLSGWTISNYVYWINTQPFVPNSSESFAIVNCVAWVPDGLTKTEEWIDRAGPVFLFILITSIFYIVRSLQQSLSPTQLVQGIKNWITIYFSSVFCFLFFSCVFSNCVARRP